VEWTLVESDDALAGLLAGVAGSRAVAVDTEFMRRNTFYPRVALVQLSFGEQAWLIDPLAITDTAPLEGLLLDPSVTKVLHSASEDLEVFQAWLGVLPQPLFDTQRAAGLLDLGFGMGYRALVEEICGVDLPKGETRSDWLQRPLTESQCEYAAQDVAWLLPVWRELCGRCEAEGKLEWVIEEGACAVSSLANGSGDYYRRIKTAWKLDSRQLSALIAICQWREDTARSRDKPRNWIIDDRACLQLAQQDPRDRAQLTSRVELPHPALRRYGDQLLELLQQQRELPDSSLPRRLPGPLHPPQREQLKRLRGAARQIATDLHVAPEALLQSRDYELLLRHSEGEAVSEPPHWSGWRAEAVIEPLRRMLREDAP